MGCRMLKGSTGCTGQCSGAGAWCIFSAQEMLTAFSTSCFLSRSGILFVFLERDFRWHTMAVLFSVTFKSLALLLLGFTHVILLKSFVTLLTTLRVNGCRRH